MKDFNVVSGWFENDEIEKLSNTDDGIKYLKLRSMNRKELMSHLIEKCDIDIGESKSKDWLKIIYNSSVTIDVIDQIIRELYERDRKIRRKNEPLLVNELYKINNFSWGGLHQNNLEKAIVDNYVKKIKSYELLNDAIENDIYKSMRAYAVASWYNHWSSIIIEDVFKDHPKVIPAIGLVKKIDFFFNNKPYDLKVTYLPEGYIKQCRKDLNLKPELQLMKTEARKLDLTFSTKLKDYELIPDLWKKLDDHPSSQIVKELSEVRETILRNAISNPEHLIKWLYENQGPRRYDASNRLFLILVDRGNYFESWRLKRAKPLIMQEVNHFLDNADNDVGLEIKFIWKDKFQSATSNIVFVVK